MATRIYLACLLIVALPALTFGQSRKRFQAPDVTEILPLLNASSPQALSGVLRGVLLKHLPNPLHDKRTNWGNQRMTRRVRWEKRGILRRPRIVKVPKNDGTWRHVRMTAISPAQTLVLDIRNVRFPEPSRMTFEVFLAFDARAEVTQQNWERGIRLWSGTVRARFRAKLHMFCEATTKLTPNKKSLLPDAVFRMRATKANIAYDNLVYERLPGIGGTAARVLGKTFHRALNQFKPSVERRLLERGNASIVRAADTREVRISLSRVFEKMLRAN